MDNLSLVTVSLQKNFGGSVQINYMHLQASATSIPGNQCRLGYIINCLHTMKLKKGFMVTMVSLYS